MCEWIKAAITGLVMVQCQHNVEYFGDATLKRMLYCPFCAEKIQFLRIRAITKHVKEMVEASE